MESKLGSRIQEIKDLFYQDRLGPAMQALTDLQKEKANNELDQEECEKENLDGFLESELVINLKNDIETGDKYFKIFEEELSGWKKVKEKGSMKTWCKHQKGNPSVYIAAQCVIQCPFFNPFGLFNEIDLYKKWMPQVFESTQLAKLSQFRRLFHVKLKFPLFFSNRDYAASAVLNIDQKRKIALFSLKEIKSGEYFGYKIPPAGKFVRLEVKLACLSLEYIDDSTVRFRCVTNVNPKLAIIPMVLINWATKKIFFSFLKIFSKKCINLQEEYKERIKKDEGGVYTEVQKRLSEILGKPIPIPFLEWVQII